MVPGEALKDWPVQVRKGLVELAVLTLLARQSCYVFQMARILSTLHGLALTEGTLYPLLSRLRVQKLVQTKLVESSSGPARKYYLLTERGRASLAAMLAYSDRLFKDLNQLRSMPLEDSE